MKIRRRGFLILLLAGCVATWLVVLKIERAYRLDAENYSLIEDGLYMGGDVDDPPPDTGAVVNLCRRPDTYETDIYLWRPIADNDRWPGMNWLWRIVAFVDAQRRKGITTYVHCRNGVSRSGMVVTAYEMYKNDWTRDRALAFVRSKRPVARPNPAFMQRLSEWERLLKSPNGKGKAADRPSGK